MKRESALPVKNRIPFRRFAVSFVLASVACGFLPGCLVARGMLAIHQRDPLAGAPRLRNARNPRVEEVVAHLNQNTERIQSWRANRVRITADGWLLSGTIAVEKGRHLRLEVTSMRGKEVDLGSNDERFWVWSRDMDPGFVTCKHENLERAREMVGIPFEPDWLMQALGVESIPTTGVTMQSDPANEHVRLVEHIVSAHGQPLRRAVVVDLKKGIVVEHSLYNYNSVPIATAKLSDHRHDKDSGVVLPHRVVIELPQNKMAMTMCLSGVQVNPNSIPSTVWEMPHIRDCQVVNLDAGIPTGGIRMVTRPDNSESTEDSEPIETIRSHDPHNFLRDDPRLSDHAWQDEVDAVSPVTDHDAGYTGRVRLSTPVMEDEAETEDDADSDTEDDWSK